MATKLQRKLLWQLIKEKGVGIFVTGNKSTSWGDTLKQGGAIIYCSECVLFGLTASRFMAKETPHHTGKIEDRLYRITTEGLRAAGKEEPEMKVLWTGAHGIRWGMIIFALLSAITAFAQEHPQLGVKDNAGLPIARCVALDPIPTGCVLEPGRTLDELIGSLYLYQQKSQVYQDGVAKALIGCEVDKEAIRGYSEANFEFITRSLSGKPAVKPKPLDYYRNLAAKQLGIAP